MDVLYFEPTDEVTKAIERVRESSSRQVAMVLPRGSIILQSIVNLKLIARTATATNKELSIVTVDKIGRNLALQVGIPVFGKIEGGKVTGKVLQKTPEPVTPQGVRDQVMRETEEITTVTGIQVHRYDSHDKLNQLTEAEPEVVLGDPATPITPVSYGFPVPAEEKDETASSGGGTITHLRDSSGRDMGRRRLKVSPKTKKVVLGVAGLVIALAAAGLWWFYPKTTVTLTLKGEKKDVNLTIKAGIESVADKDVTLKSLSITKEGSKTVPATGTKNTGNTATGTVNLVNKYGNAPITIASGTTIQTSDGKQYTTTVGVVVPGAVITVEGTTQTLKQSGTVEVNVTAAAAGDQYNINSGTLSISGVTDQKDGKVYADTPKITGGTTQTLKLVTAADIDGAKSQLIEQLTSDANSDAINQSSTGEIIKEASATEITSFSADANPTDQKDQVTVRASIKVNALVVSRDDLAGALTKKGNADVGADKQFTLDPASLAYTVSSASSATGTAILSAKATGSVAAKIDQVSLTKQLGGKSQKAAEEVLKAVPLYQSTTFTYDPSWLWHRLPKSVKHISLQILYVN